MFISFEIFIAFIYWLFKLIVYVWLSFFFFPPRAAQVKPNIGGPRPFGGASVPSASPRSPAQSWQSPKPAPTYANNYASSTLPRSNAPGERTNTTIHYTQKRSFFFFNAKFEFTKQNISAKSYSFLICIH